MKKCLALLSTLVFSASAWAGVPPQPEKCPSVATIAQNKFVTAQKATDGTYGALMLNKFDGNEMWGFVIAEIVAASSQDALAKATAALGSLALLSGPMYFSSNNLWGCVYSVEDGYPVLALTPLPAQVRSAQDLLQLEK